MNGALGRWLPPLAVCVLDLLAIQNDPHVSEAAHRIQEELGCLQWTLLIASGFKALSRHFTLLCGQPLCHLRIKDYIYLTVLRGKSAWRNQVDRLSQVSDNVAHHFPVLYRRLPLLSLGHMLMLERCRPLLLWEFALRRLAAACMLLLFPWMWLHCWECDDIAG